MSFPSEVTALILSYSVGSVHLRKMARSIDRNLIILSAKLFLGRKKDISYRDALYIFEEIFLSLPVACSIGNLPFVEYYLDNFPSHEDEIVSAIRKASAKGDRKILQCFKDRDIDITFKDSVLCAVREGKIGTVQWLIEQGADPCILKSPDSLFATMYGPDNLHMLKWLIGLGVRIRDHASRLLLDACNNGKAIIAKFLIKNGGYVNFSGGACLIQACYGEHTKVIKVLLEHGVDRNKIKAEIIKACNYRDRSDIITQIYGDEE